jgi:hypothetical protein
MVGIPIKIRVLPIGDVVFRNNGNIYQALTRLMSFALLLIVPLSTALAEETPKAPDCHGFQAIADQSAHLVAPVHNPCQLSDTKPADIVDGLNEGLAKYEENLKAEFLQNLEEAVDTFSMGLFDYTLGLTIRKRAKDKPKLFVCQPTTLVTIGELLIASRYQGGDPFCDGTFFNETTAERNVYSINAGTIARVSNIMMQRKPISDEEASRLTEEARSSRPGYFLHQKVVSGDTGGKWAGQIVNYAADYHRNIRTFHSPVHQRSTQMSIAQAIEQGFATGNDVFIERQLRGSVLFSKYFNPTTGKVEVDRFKKDFTSCDGENDCTSTIARRFARIEYEFIKEKQRKCGRSLRRIARYCSAKKNGKVHIGGMERSEIKDIFKSSPDKVKCVGGLLSDACSKDESNMKLTFAGSAVGGERASLIDLLEGSPFELSKSTCEESAGASGEIDKILDGANLLYHETEDHYGDGDVAPGQRTGPGRDDGDDTSEMLNDVFGDLGPTGKTYNWARQSDQGSFVGGVDSDEPGLPSAKSAQGAAPLAANGLDTIDRRALIAETGAAATTTTIPSTMSDTGLIDTSVPASTAQAPVSGTSSKVSNVGPNRDRSDLARDRSTADSRRGSDDLSDESSRKLAELRSELDRVKEESEALEARDTAPTVATQTSTSTDTATSTAPTTIVRGGNTPTEAPANVAAAPVALPESSAPAASAGRSPSSIKSGDADGDSDGKSIAGGAISLRSDSDSDLTIYSAVANTFEEIPTENLAAILNEMKEGEFAFIELVDNEGKAFKVKVKKENGELVPVSKDSKDPKKIKVAPLEIQPDEVKRLRDLYREMNEKLDTITGD